jgi:hypothetical protein
MAGLAAACLRAEPRVDRVDRVDAADPSGERMWIVVEPPRDGGTAALRDLLAHAPLDTWTARFGLAPVELVRLPVADDHGADVHAGWARATVLARDAAWARALLARGAVAKRLEPAMGLLGVLPADEREAAAADLIRRADGYRDLIRILDHVPGPWAGALADTVLGLLAAAADRPDVARVGHLARLAEERLSPGVAPRLVEITRQHDTWPLTELAETLRFRHDMLEELA